MVAFLLVHCHHYRDAPVLSNMYLLPSSFGKFLSRFQANHTKTQLPIYTHSQSTLFDDLPEDEKKAALAKLHELADRQPGLAKTKTPVHRRRYFDW